MQARKISGNVTPGSFLKIPLVIKSNYQKLPVSLALGQVRLRQLTPNDLPGTNAELEAKQAPAKIGPQGQNDIPVTLLTSAPCGASFSAGQERQKLSGSVGPRGNRFPSARSSSERAWSRYPSEDHAAGDTFFLRHRDRLLLVFSRDCYRRRCRGRLCSVPVRLCPDHHGRSTRQTFWNNFFFSRLRIKRSPCLLHKPRFLP